MKERLSIKLLEELENQFINQEGRSINIAHLLNIFPFMKKHLTLHMLDWKIEFGVHKAHVTAVLYGFVHSMLYGVLFFLKKMLVLETKPSLTINPNFQEQIFHMKIKSISSLSIYRGMYILWRYRRTKKRRK